MPAAAWDHARDESSMPLGLTEFEKLTGHGLTWLPMLHRAAMEVAFGNTGTSASAEIDRRFTRSRLRTVLPFV